MNLKAVEQFADVVMDGGRTKSQIVGDFLLALAGQQALQCLPQPRRQLGIHGIGLAQLPPQPISGFHKPPIFAGLLFFYITPIRSVLGFRE